MKRLGTNGMTPRNSEIWLVTAVFLLLLLSGSTVVMAQVPNFTNFNSTANLTLNQYASQFNNGTANMLRLTAATNIANDYGSAWFNVQQPITAGFSTTFTFQISDNIGIGNYPADGLAFVIQNSPTGTAALGPGGGGIGYGDVDGSTGGIPNSLAVEFDTYPYNTGDPSGLQHVAVQSCGTAANNADETSSCGLGVNSSLPITLSDGNPHTVQIDYTPPAPGCVENCPGHGTLQVTLDNHALFTAPGISVPELGSFLGLNSGGAWVGFTGATGAYVENGDILSWTFSPGISQTLVLSPAATPFDFSTETGAPTIQTIDYTNSGTNPSGTSMKVTFEPISQTQFNNLVAGTFAQGSQCMPQQISPNNFSCAVTIALCSNTPSDPTSFAGTNCPQSSSAANSTIGLTMKYFTNAFGDPTTVPAPGYLAATDDALNCVNDSANSCRKLHNIFTGIANDCCTTSGGTKSFNSLFVPVFNLPTWYQPAGTMCNGEAGHQILQPVNADGTSVWKVGRTIPLKFRVCNAHGLSVGTAAVIKNFQLVSRSNGTVVSVIDENADANIVDNGFRFDTTAQQWIFNLSTKGFIAPATYVYQINLNDGTQINFQFGLR
ncbi:MAG: lectin-like domain-containing protein [Candidatus Sulfotelmatobacter sp.]